MPYKYDYALDIINLKIVLRYVDTFLLSLNSHNNLQIKKKNSHNNPYNNENLY